MAQQQPQDTKQNPTKESLNKILKYIPRDLPRDKSEARGFIPRAESKQLKKATCLDACDVQDLIYYHRGEAAEKNQLIGITDNKFAERKWGTDPNSPPVYYRITANNNYAIFSGAHDNSFDDKSTALLPGCSLKRLLLNYRKSRANRGDERGKEGTEGFEQELIIPLAKSSVQGLHHWTLLHINFVINNKCSTINATLYDSKGEYMRLWPTNHIAEAIQEAFPGLKINFSRRYLGNQSLFNNHDCGKWVALYAAKLSRGEKIGFNDRLAFDSVEPQSIWNINIITNGWFRLVLVILVVVIFSAITQGVAVPFLAAIAIKFGIVESLATALGASIVEMAILALGILFVDFIYMGVCRLFGLIVSEIQNTINVFSSCCLPARPENERIADINLGNLNSVNFSNYDPNVPAAIQVGEQQEQNINESSKHELRGEDDNDFEVVEVRHSIPSVTQTSVISGPLNKKEHSELESRNVLADGEFKDDFEPIPSCSLF